MVRQPSFLFLFVTLACITAVGCGSGPAEVGTGNQASSEVSSVATRPSGAFLRAVGTVQDGGLPHVACSCERCEIARREPLRRGRVASLAIAVPDESRTSGYRVYLIDVTPDIREQLDALRDLRDAPPNRVDRAPVDGVFLTHGHMGHYTGLAFFGFEAAHAQAIPLWATDPMAEFLSNNGPWSQLVRLENIELRPLIVGADVDLGAGVSVTAVAVPHRDEYTDTVGFLISGPRQTVLYVPDTDTWQAWDPPLVERLDGVDLAILDGTFFSESELPGRSVASIGHPLIRDSLERLGEAVSSGEVEVFFSHLNHSNPALDPDSAERKTIEDAGFRVLAEGQEIEL